MPKRGAFALGPDDARARPAPELPDARATSDARARRRARDPRRPPARRGDRLDHDRIASGTAPAPSSAADATAGTRAARQRGPSTGPSVDTRYGPVQVEVTIENGQITDVTALQLPVGRPVRPDLEQVEPMLRSQALSAQSASIDGVSGATYTSDAYARSLQAALDDAGFPLTGTGGDRGPPVAPACPRRIVRVEPVMGTTVTHRRPAAARRAVGHRRGGGLVPRRRPALQPVPARQRGEPRGGRRRSASTTPAPTSARWSRSPTTSATAPTATSTPAATGPTAASTRRGS